MPAHPTESVIEALRQLEGSLPPMRAQRLLALARHGAVAEGIIACRLASAPDVARRWIDTALAYDDPAQQLTAALCTAARDPSRAAHVLATTAQALASRERRSDGSHEALRRQLLLLWAASLRTSLDASATQSILLEAESLLPGQTLPGLVRLGGYVKPRAVLDTLSNLLGAVGQTTEPRRQGLLLLRLHFISSAIRIPEFQRSSSLLEHAHDGAGGALLALMLHHVERQTSRPEPIGDDTLAWLRFLAEKPADPAERCCFAIRLSRALASRGELDHALLTPLPDAASGQMLERIRLDQLHVQALANERTNTAVRTALERTRACQDPALRVAWHVRHLFLLRASSAPLEAIQGASTELRQAVERTPRPLPAVQAFANEIALAAALAVGDEELALSIADNPSIDPLIPALLKATQPLAQPGKRLDHAADLAQNHPDIGLPLLAALSENHPVPDMLARVERLSAPSAPLRDLATAWRIQSGHPGDHPVPLDTIHGAWLRAEIALDRPYARKCAEDLAADAPDSSALTTERTVAARVLLTALGHHEQASALQQRLADHLPAEQQSLIASLGPVGALPAAPAAKRSSPFLNALNKGLKHLDEGHWIEAADTFIELTADAPDDAARSRLLKLAAQAQALAGRTEQAITTWEALLGHEGPDFDPPEDLINLALEARRFDDALSWAEGRRAPLGEDLREQLIATFTSLQPAAAGRALILLVRDLPADEPDTVRQTVELMIRNHPKLAIHGDAADVVLIAWMRAQGEHVPILRTTLHVLVANGASITAELLLDFIRGQAASSQRLLELEQLFADAGLPRAFADILLVALPGLDNPAPAAASAIRLLLGPANSPRDARDVLDHALSRTPRDPHLQLLAAQMAEDEGDHPRMAEALETAARGIAEPGERSEVYARLGKLYEDKLDAPNLALEQYLVSFICDSGNSDSFNNLARLYRRAGRQQDLLGVLDIAIQHVEESGNGAMDLEDLLLQRAQLELEHLQDPERAAQTILRCIRRTPGETFFIDLLVQQVAPRLPDAEPVRTAIELYRDAKPDADLPEQWTRAISPAR